MKKQKYLIDANFLTSLIVTKDANHLLARKFYDGNPKVIWVVPTLAYFEHQATISKLKSKYRGIYIRNFEAIEVTMDFTIRIAGINLVAEFQNLKGADLVYACLAFDAGIPLVTFDKQFNQYAKKLQLIQLTPPKAT